MDLHVDLIKGGMAAYGVGENAIFMPGIRDPQYSEWIAFSGVSVDLAGKQHYLDSQLAYSRACNHATVGNGNFRFVDSGLGEKGSIRGIVGLLRVQKIWRLLPP